MPPLALVANPPLALISGSPNPPAPGYQSKRWTRQDWRSVIPRGNTLDYSHKCGAEGTRVRGKPALCLPHAVIQKVLRRKGGKKELLAHAKKKLRAKKGQRVPYGPIVGEVFRAFQKADTFKDRPVKNPPSNPRRSPALREFLRLVKEHGGQEVGVTRHSHLYEVAGARFGVAKTPSDPRADKNELAKLKRHLRDQGILATKTKKKSKKKVRKGPTPLQQERAKAKKGDPLSIALQFVRERDRFRQTEGHDKLFQVSTFLKNLGSPVTNAELGEILRAYQQQAEAQIDQGKRRRNPSFNLFGMPVDIGFSGPSVTFAPFSPFQKLSVDLLGVGARVGGSGSRKKNPPGTVVVDVRDGSSQELPGDPYYAVLEAWKRDHQRTHGAPPCDTGCSPLGLYRRCGPFLALLPTPPHASNPPPESGGALWAQHTLDLVWLSRSHPMGGIVLGADPPAIFIPRRLFYDYWLRLHPEAGSQARERAYQKWSKVCRDLGLERDTPDVVLGEAREPVVLESGESVPRGLALDVLAAYDRIWVELGSPHPLSTDRHLGGPYAGEGRSRELELLQQRLDLTANAEQQGYTPRPSALELREEIQRAEEFYGEDAADDLGEEEELELQFLLEMREEAIRMLQDPDSVAHLPQVEKLTDPRLPTPGREVRRATLDPDFDPGMKLLGPGEDRPFKGRGEQTTLFNPQVRQELQRLTDPRRPRRRNRDAKYKEPPETYELPLDEVADHEQYEVAEHKYKRFHERLPEKATVFLVDDGKLETTRDPNLYVALHETLEVPYVVPWQSQKSGVVWFHEHPEDGRPLKVLNPMTGITLDIGGNYVVDDYWYS